MGLYRREPLRDYSVDGDVVSCAFWFFLPKIQNFFSFQQQKRSLFSKNMVSISLISDFGGLTGGDCVATCLATVTFTNGGLPPPPPSESIPPSLLLLMISTPLNSINQLRPILENLTDVLISVPCTHVSIVTYNDSSYLLLPPTIKSAEAINEMLADAEKLKWGRGVDLCEGFDLAASTILSWRESLSASPPLGAKNPHSIIVNVLLSPPSLSHTDPLLIVDYLENVLTKCRCDVNIVNVGIGAGFQVELFEQIRGGFYKYFPAGVDGATENSVNVADGSGLADRYWFELSSTIGDIARNGAGMGENVKVRLRTSQNVKVISLQECHRFGSHDSVGGSAGNNEGDSYVNNIIDGDNDDIYHSHELKRFRPFEERELLFSLNVFDGSRDVGGVWVGGEVTCDIVKNNAVIGTKTLRLNSPSPYAGCRIQIVISMEHCMKIAEIDVARCLLGRIVKRIESSRREVGDGDATERANFDKLMERAQIMGMRLSYKRRKEVLLKNMEKVTAKVTTKGEGGGDEKLGAMVNEMSVGNAEGETIGGVYKLLREIGRGSYGVIYEAETSSGVGEAGVGTKKVAIKQIKGIFDNDYTARMTWREIRLLYHLRGHKSVIEIEKVICEGGDDHLTYRSVFVAMNLMESDLQKVISSSEKLSNRHIRHFLYQLLLGVHRLHSSGIIHRDLKPGNLLVNSECDVKIADLGMARGIVPGGRVGSEGEDRDGKRVVGALMTEYVVTRWYRAPEILYSGGVYGTGIDMWSVGCIFYELLMRKPIFPGRDYISQLKLIVNVTLGKKEMDRLSNNLKTSDIKLFMKGRETGGGEGDAGGGKIESMLTDPKNKGVGAVDSISKNEIDLLKGLLHFDIEKRWDTKKALNHNIFAKFKNRQSDIEAAENVGFYQEESEGSSSTPNNTIDAVRKNIWSRSKSC